MHLRPHTHPGKPAWHAHRCAVAVCAALLFGAMACGTRPASGPTIPSILEPASPSAEAIANLWWLIFWVMVAIFVGVAVALALFYRRFRFRPGNERGRPIGGNRTLEIAWTAAPALILVVVFLLSLRVMTAVDNPPGGTVRVVAVGHLWWWEFRLPELGVVTANELHLPVGERVEIELLAEEVIHSFWVPQLMGKHDMIPGHTNRLAFVPTQTGVFRGACGEFCGVQHAWMRLRVVVETPEEFEEWARRQSQDALPPRGMLAQRGQEIFFSTTCQSCHHIRGHGGVAGVGPDLTHMASRSILAAGRLENTPENMALWLDEPQLVKPGNFMPDLRLTEEQIAALTAYMLELE